MRTVLLSCPLPNGETVIRIRPPGKNVVSKIDGFVDDRERLPIADVPPIASRLSGVSERAISRLPESDRVALKHAIEGQYFRQKRRLSSCDPASRR